MYASCSHSQGKKLYSNVDYLSEMSFEVHRCKECGYVFTRIPKGLTTNDAYPATYYGEGSRRFGALGERIIVFFRKRRAQFIASFFTRPGSVLDVGCGRGAMLSLLQKVGWEVVGTEIAQAAAGVQYKTGFPIKLITDFLEVDNEKYDVVTLFHVFEHLTKPFAVLDTLVESTKPGGIVVIEVPNISSIQAKLSKGRWFHLDCPRHTFHFSKSQLEGLLVSKGLAILHVGTHSLEYGYFGMVQSLLNLVTVNMNVLYLLLKERRLRYEARYVMDVVITGVLLLPAIMIGVLLEAISSLFGQGGVVRVVGRKS